MTNEEVNDLSRLIDEEIKDEHKPTLFCSYL